MERQEQVNELVERLGRDSNLATALEKDSFATLRDMGLDDLATSVEQERERIRTLIDRIYADDDFRQAVEQDPTKELSEWGLPEEAIEPVLVMAGAPDDVLERATADVEAHLSGRNAAAIAAVLGTLAFAQQATAAANPAQSTTQGALPAHSTVQALDPARSTVEALDPARSTVEAVDPAHSTVEAVDPARSTVQVSRNQARVQVSKPAQAKWHGIDVQRVQGQSFAKLLRMHRTSL
jgi:putative modified peptide